MNAKQTSAIVAAAAVAAGTTLYLTTPTPTPVHTVQLVWNCNYTVSNEETVIISTTNLALPLTNWTIRFIGATNQCVLPRTNAVEYFRAYNRLP